MITIGAGVGLMGFSVFFADLILLNFTHNKKLFQKLKEVHANDMDEIETINIENMKIYDDCKVQQGPLDNSNNLIRPIRV